MRADRAIRSTGWTRSSQTLVPDSRTSPTTCKDIVRPVLDDRYFFEVQADFAPNIVVGFGRLGGRPVGHRRQPARAPGRLPRHRRLAQGRALRALLRLLQHPARHLRGRARASCPAPRRSTAASSSTAPSCSTPSARRRCRSSPSSPARPTAAPTASWRSKHIRGDVNFAFPTAEIAVMGPEGAVNILYRARWRRPTDPAALKDEKVARVPREVRQPVRGGGARLHRRGDRAARHAARGSSQALEILHTKRDSNPPKKHGNIPL